MHRPRQDRTRKQTLGEYSATRVEWATIGFFNAIIHDGTEEDLDSELFDIPPVSLVFRTIGGKGSHKIRLTQLTHPELMALKEVIDDAIKLAEPRVIELDKKAQEALANGNDSFARLYRPVPQVVRRQQRQPQHDEGVLDGPSHAPEGSGGGDGNAGGGDSGG